MSANTSKHKKQLALGIISAWLIATVIAFWWFQVKDLRPFDQEMSSLIEEQSLAANIQQLIQQQLNISPEHGYIINFWRPGCNCSRFNITHVKTLNTQYRKKGLEVITLVPSSADYSDEQLAEMAQEKFSTPAIVVSDRQFSGASRIPAIPSAAILNRNGQLHYFGPYNDGAFCGIGGTRFVEKVADLLIEDENPNIINTLSYGCYCSWT